MYQRIETDQFTGYGKFDDEPEYYRRIKTVDDAGNYHQHTEDMNGNKFGIPWDTTVREMGYQDTNEFLREMKRRKLSFEKVGESS